MVIASAIEPAVILSLIAAGIFFHTGLFTGIGKYRCMQANADGQARYYVNIAHRSALLYSFAALLRAQFARSSVWPVAVNFVAALAALLFFVFAIASYILRGWLEDTDNQLQAPFVLGPRRLPPWVIGIAMWSLIVAKIGGSLVLFSGFILGLFQA